ncbi:MAG: chaperone NapD [Rhodocyclaceae bacterium]|nr:chaperone NapD [Rhodocyclaceae bacterium]MBX3669372.1 chaperone NapD [Rhodocyclaceae bacterium]
MNINSMIIRARPERLAEVSASFADIPGVEIHGSSTDGRMIVTVEDGPGHTVEDSMLAVHTAPGVLSATLVYQYAGSDAEDTDLTATGGSNQETQA